MASAREINIKPTFMNQLHALPRDVLPAATEKIAWLAADPLPDGDLKKKVKGLDGVYRLRVRDYRLFYSFGDTWIRRRGLPLERPGPRLGAGPRRGQPVGAAA